MSKCERCVSDKSWCIKCIDNPIYQTILQALPQKSCFMYYKPVCPRGYVDCVCDPAYIKYHYEEWYKELYGDMTPEEAIYKENGCWDSFINDPYEKYYCYDDEDK